MKARWFLKVRMMINDILKDAEQRMQKSIEVLRGELAKVRTGRAHPSILDHVTVDYYGSEVPLNQVANVTVEDSRTLSLTPWEKTMVLPIEKAIMNSDLGLNPATAGMVIRVPMPPLTEERRRDLVKVVKGEAENSRISIRNIRRDAITQVKAMLKDKALSEDEARQAEEQAQKLTDRFVGEVDETLANKEKDLMAI